MTIQHFKRSDIAMAPDELSKCINKYTEHSSFVSQRNLKPGKFDLVHFHNKVWQHRMTPWGKPSLIQFHSEPRLTDYDYYTGVSLVVAQYQATLPEYSHAYPIRNIIDFVDNPQYGFREVPTIRIAYSPSSSLKKSKWADKGYTETVGILNRLKEVHPAITIDVISGTTLEDSIARKAKASIVIDECVTGSYHRSALEGLALGKVTIAHLNPDVEAMFKKVSGSDFVPIRNVKIEGLYSELERLIRMDDYMKLVEEGRRNREWMYNHWHPKAIVDEYVSFYKYALNHKPVVPEDKTTKLRRRKN